MNTLVERSIISSSLPAALLLAAIATLVLALAKFLHADGYTRLGRVAIPAFLALLIPPLFLMAVGPGLLSILGVAQRLTAGTVTLALMREELTDGTLALRISSILIGFHLVRLEVIRLTYAFNTRRRSPSKSPLGDPLSDLHLAQAQYLFYGICAAAIWFARINESQSFVSSAVSWALLFITDDWTLLQEYLRSQSALPSRWLLIKILVIDILLLVGVLVIFKGLGLLGWLAFAYIPIGFTLLMGGADFMELWQATFRKSQRTKNDGDDA